MSDEVIEVRAFGRALRLILGIALTIEGARHLIDSSPGLPAWTAGVVVGEIVIYALIHLVMSRFFGVVHHCVSCFVAVTPVALVFAFGGPAGSLGSCIFIGVSLVLTGIRAEGGCEVMTIPGMLLGKRTHLGCVVFSPIDWVETQVTDWLRGNEGHAKT